MGGNAEVQAVASAVSTSRDQVGAEFFFMSEGYSALGQKCPADFTGRRVLYLVFLRLGRSTLPMAAQCVSIFGAYGMKNLMRYGMSLGTMLGAIGLLSGCAGPVGGPPAGASGGGRERQESIGARASCRSPVEQLRSDLNEVGLALGLSPVQVPLWEKYEDSALALATVQFPVASGSALGRSANQQIETKIITARRWVDQMAAVEADAKAVYHTLDESQRRTADRLLAATFSGLRAILVCQIASPQGGDRGGERSGAGVSISVFGGRVRGDAFVRVPGQSHESHTRPRRCSR